MDLGIYTLDGRTPVPCHDFMTWAMWMEKNRASCRVADTDVDECWVSTVFLGLNHRHFGPGEPLVFETMAFGPPTPTKVFNGEMRMLRPDICSMNRYSTWDAAQLGHERIVAEVRDYLLDTAVKADEALLAIAAK